MSEIKNTFGNAAEDVETVMTFDGGWRIVRLLTVAALRHEGAQMQNCMRHGDADESLLKNDAEYFSLRGPGGKSHATISVNSLSIVKQCKGKQNAIIAEKYAPYILAFIAREELHLSLKAGETGFWCDENGVIHNIRNLPEGAVLRTELDVSRVKDIRLPKNLTLENGLIVNGAAPPELPGCLETRRVTFVWRKGGLLHRDGGEPARIVKLWPSGSVVLEEWFREGYPYREEGPAAVMRSPCRPG